VALQITPRVNTSGKVVILDIHSRLAVREPEGEARHAPKQVQEDKEDKDASPAAVVAAIDRPRLLTQRITTTLRVPVERIVLVGGTTVSSKLKEGERPLYLFVRATVQELRDDTKPGVPQPEPGKDEKPAAGQPESK
jgi:hypothetical protein